ncbi:hypothetical protein KFK09_022637 [Dendrobium nobile]|uniref:Uncharacterized protein n=1 Tax=Dendrobium nobile TaxID=94219 RepID=A0A8T3AJX9_DENNO|nr:hypothetical protein KFK09_022637 [Dendrobium nobile]
MHAFVSHGGMGPRCGAYGEAGSLIGTPELGESKLPFFKKMLLKPNARLCWRGG